MTWPLQNHGTSFLSALHDLTASYHNVVCSSLCVFIPVNGSLLRRKYSTLPPPRDKEEKALLDSMLRVDHAGEYGASCIYAGQMAVLGRTQTGPLIQVLNSWRVLAEEDVGVLSLAGGRQRCEGRESMGNEETRLLRCCLEQNPFVLSNEMTQLLKLEV